MRDPTNGCARQAEQLGFKIAARLHNSSKLGEIIRFRRVYGLWLTALTGWKSADWLTASIECVETATQRPPTLPSAVRKRRMFRFCGAPGSLGSDRRNAQSIEREFANGAEQADADDGFASL